MLQWMRYLIVVAIVLHDDLPILIIHTARRKELPATAVLRNIIAVKRSHRVGRKEENREKRSLQTLIYGLPSVEEESATIKNDELNK